MPFIIYAALALQALLVGTVLFYAAKIEIHNTRKYL